MVCGEEKEKEVMFNKIVVENVEVGNGNKESTYRNRKTSIRTVLAGKCQVIDVGKFPATKSKVVYGVLLPQNMNLYQINDFQLIGVYFCCIE